jgi:hypothetical protein
MQNPNSRLSLTDNLGGYFAMFTEVEVIARTDDYITQKFPDFSLRAVLPHPLKLPGGWRVVYEAYPEFGLRQSDTMVIVFLTDGGEVEDPPEVSELTNITDPDQGPVIAENRLEQLIQSSKLPGLNAAINFVKQQIAPDATIVTYEPVIKTYMQTKGLQVLCWRFDVFVGNSHHKVYVAYREGSFQNLALSSSDISHQTRLVTNLDDYRGLKRYGRLDLNYEAESLKIRVDLSRIDQSTGFSQQRLMIMRDELLLWYCKTHAANYLESMGYEGLDYSLISLDRKVVNRSEMARGESPEMDPLGVVFIARKAVLISPLIFRDSAQKELLMISWLQDPSIIFHELGHAFRYLLYTQETNYGIEEGFCDYFSAVLMDNLLESEGFAYREDDGVGSLLPRGIFKGRFLPRRFGGLERPPDFPDLAESERPYAFGWKWAHFLWQLRGCLYQVTNDWLKADQVITAAHFKPRFPKDQDGLSIAQQYQASLWTTIQINQIPLQNDSWQSLLEANPLPS